MRALSTTTWTLCPTSPLVLVSFCSRCDADQPLICTSRFRVNAHKKRLDVWLLLQCPRCDHTVKWPVHERIGVSALPRDRLAALEANDPGLASAVAIAAGATAPVDVRGAVPEGPFIARLRCPPGTRWRLDRVVASALGVSRAAVAHARRRGQIHLVPPDARAWSRPARDGQEVVVTLTAPRPRTPP